MGSLSGSLTANTLAAPNAAAPNDASTGPDLDSLFAELEKHLNEQASQSQAALSTEQQAGEAAINATTPPTPQPVPSRMSGPARALATFGAGLGASLTRQPGMLTNVQNQINASDQEASQVERSNYAHSAAFDQNKQSTLLSHQLKLLELKAEEQIKAGDRDGALQTLKAQTQIAEKVRKEKEAADLRKQSSVIGMKLQSALQQIGARSAAAKALATHKDHLITGGMSKDQLAEYNARATALRSVAQAQLEDIATMAGGEGLVSEEGAAKAQEIADAVDANLRSIAQEIRGRAPQTPPAGGGTDTPPAAGTDANGIPTDPIRRAVYLRQHPDKK